MPDSAQYSDWANLGWSGGASVVRLMTEIVLSRYWLPPRCGRAIDRRWRRWWARSHRNRRAGHRRFRREINDTDVVRTLIRDDGYSQGLIDSDGLRRSAHRKRRSAARWGSNWQTVQAEYSMAAASGSRCFDIAILTNKGYKPGAGHRAAGAPQPLIAGCY